MHGGVTCTRLTSQGSAEFIHNPNSLGGGSSGGVRRLVGGSSGGLSGGSSGGNSVGQAFTTARDLWQHDASPLRVFEISEGEIDLWHAMAGFGIHLATLLWDSDVVLETLHPASGYALHVELLDGTLTIRTRDLHGKPYHIVIARFGSPVSVQW